MKWVRVCTAALCALGLGVWLLRPSLPDTPSMPLNSAKLDTVLVFGTSLSSAPRYSWPDDLAAALETCNKTPTQIIRVTQASANSTWGIGAIESVTRAEPDVVILEFAINDADITDGLSLPQSHDTHAAILDRLDADLPDAQFVLMTTNPVSGLNLLKRYRLGAYFRLYSSLAADYGTGLIHMAPHWAGSTIPDGVHPQNEDASAVMVPHLLATLTDGRC